MRSSMPSLPGADMYSSGRNDLRSSTDVLASMDQSTSLVVDPRLTDDMARALQTHIETHAIAGYGSQALQVFFCLSVWVSRSLSLELHIVVLDVWNVCLLRRVNIIRGLAVRNE